MNYKCKYRYAWETDEAYQAHLRDNDRTWDEKLKIAQGIGLAEYQLKMEHKYSDDDSNYCPHCHIMLPTATRICDMCGYDGNKRK